MSDNTYTNDVTTDALSPSGAYTTYPLQIDYVAVTFDVPSANISVPGRVTYVSPGVVQIQVPWELAGQTSAQMKVVLDGDLFGNVVTIPLATYAPQFFTNGNNIADAQDATTYSLITPSNPAKKGELLVLYANGLGPVNNNPGSGVPPTGASSTTQQPVTVTIGGQTATPIFAGSGEFPRPVPDRRHRAAGRRVWHRRSSDDQCRRRNLGASHLADPVDASGGGRRSVLVVCPGPEWQTTHGDGLPQ